MNWVFKIVAKIILSRAPLRYRTFRDIGVFRHGKMHEIEYSMGVFFKHLDKMGGAKFAEGKTLLEVGPGDSLASAVLAHAVGAEKIYLVDAGDFADTSMLFYYKLLDELEKRNYPVAHLRNATTTQEMLCKINAHYLTDGLQSLKTIPSRSVDMIWSQAVLEHIRFHEVPQTLAELNRVMTISGTMSHRIDYKDHLGGSLNNLRFSSLFWECDAIARSGFYTNRIRNSQFLKLLEEAGFHLKHVEAGLWDEMPLPRKKMAKEFQSLSDEDLRTRNVDLMAVLS